MSSNFSVPKWPEEFLRVQESNSKTQRNQETQLWVNLSLMPLGLLSNYRNQETPEDGTETTSFSLILWCQIASGHEMPEDYLLFADCWKRGIITSW